MSANETPWKKKNRNDEMRHFENFLSFYRISTTFSLPPPLQLHTPPHGRYTFVLLALLTCTETIVGSSETKDANITLRSILSCVHRASSLSTAEARQKKYLHNFLSPPLVGSSERMDARTLLISVYDKRNFSTIFSPSSPPTTHTTTWPLHPIFDACEFERCLYVKPYDLSTAFACDPTFIMLDSASAYLSATAVTLPWTWFSISQRTSFSILE